MFGNIKMIAIGLAALGIVSAVSLGYLHYQHILAQRDEALAERDRLTIENAQIAASRDAFKQQSERMQEAMGQMAAAQARAKRQVDDLNAKLRKHDIGKLAKAKPGMVERRINRGTARVFGLFESATAAGNGDGGGSTADRPAGAGAD